MWYRGYGACVVGCGYCGWWGDPVGVRMGGGAVGSGGAPGICIPVTGVRIGDIGLWTGVCAGFSSLGCPGVMPALEGSEWSECKLESDACQSSNCNGVCVLASGPLWRSEGD